MSTTPATPASLGAAGSDSAARSASTERRQTPGLRTALRAEWLKFATLRSSWLTVGGAVVMMVLIGTVAAAASANGEAGGPGPALTTDDPLGTVLTGSNIALLVLGVLGCLTGAREYSSRMITTTFTTSPRRWRTVVAKAVVLVAVVAPTSLIGTFGAFAAGTAILDGADVASVRLGDDGVLRSLLGMGLWLTAASLMGLGLGLLMRSTASSIGVLLATLLVVPAITGALLPDDAKDVLQVLPSNAASAFTPVQSTGDITIGAGWGAVIVVLWAAGLLGAALRAVLRRDV